MYCNSKDYWDNDYWEKFLEKNKNGNLDFLDDLWIEKYKDIFDKIKKGKAIDLGCGLGQYTEYMISKGFEVISCDISKNVLDRLKLKYPDVETLEFDMSESFPFESNSIDLVFANLSIHYFDKKTTEKIVSEIKRILKDGGYLVGTVNSTNSIDESNFKLVEENYYFNDNKYGRYFDKEQFEYFFKDFDFVVLNENTTERWNRKKVLWEFILKVKK